MKTKSNKPVMSKINWTAGMMFVGTIAIAFGVFPPEYEGYVTTGISFAGPILVMVFRTFFTNPVA